MFFWLYRVRGFANQLKELLVYLAFAFYLSVPCPRNVTDVQVISMRAGFVYVNNIKLTNKQINESRSHGNNLYIGNISRARHRKIKSESKID
jgi:hypothetical protein